MRPRIVGGIAGWIAALAPLVAVNVASFAGFFDFQGMGIAGAAALLGGILLGGALAGSIAGRPRAGYAGGAMAGAAAGGIVALFFGATALALVLITSAIDSTSPLLVDDLAGIVRMVVAVLFVAALVVAAALLAGALSARRTAAQMATSSMSQAARAPRQSSGHRRAAAHMGGAGWGDAPGRQDRPDTRYDTRNGGDPRYTGSRPRGAAQSTPVARRAGPAGHQDSQRW